MVTRTQLRSRVGPHLPVGETYLASFSAVGGIAPRLAHRFRVVAVTDVRVHVYAASWWRTGEPRRLLASLPPGTVIESRRSFVYEEIQLAGERLWVTPAWQDNLREAIEASKLHRPSSL